MGPFSGSRTLVAVCAALVLLLAGLAAVQYRWSTRVAAADAQREREHLDSAASLFAAEFDRAASEATRFLREDAAAALRSGTPLAGLPRLYAELYYLKAPAQGPREIRRLTAGGVFADAPPPAWVASPRCAALYLEEPAAVIAPIHDVATTESHGRGGARLLRTVRWRSDRCFLVRIDRDYLRQTLFPQLIRRSFGETAVREYEFAVVARSRPGVPLYGAAPRADLRKPFFAMSIAPPPLPKDALTGPSARGRAAIDVQRIETVLRPDLPDLRGPGLWELVVARRGMPLESAFEQARRRDLLLSAGVELLLVAAIVFLVVGARRMQRLAEQKMRFVAGVSHELRTPVSAIGMLARNQADGLVNGADKVKQYGELIHQQSRRLNEMVEQTLQYAGIHSGLRKSAGQQVDLAALIQQAVEARREELSRGGFAVEVAVGPDLPAFAGDPKLLRVAFDNLLDNALKHAGGGRWIRVAGTYAAAEKEVRIAVEDRGAGIDRADHVRIFEPFCRGRAAVEAQIPGSGLGLSLVRSAAEAHRGRVTLASEPGRGSTFTLHLPV